MLERNRRVQATGGSHSKFTLLSRGPFEQYVSEDAFFYSLPFNILLLIPFFLCYIL